MRTSKIPDGKGGIQILYFPDDTQDEVIERVSDETMISSGVKKADPFKDVGLSDVLKAGAQVGTNMLGKSVGGIAGLAKSITEDSFQGEKVAKDFENALTFEAPEKSQQFLEGVSNLGPEITVGLRPSPDKTKPPQPIKGKISPKSVATELALFRDFLGDTAFQGVDILNKHTPLNISPRAKASIATAASMGPDAVLTILGYKGGSSVSKFASNPGRRTLKDTSRRISTDDLRATSDTLYKILDDSGILVKDDAVNYIVREMNRTAENNGLTRFSQDQNPNTVSALNELESNLAKLEAGEKLSVSELVQLRKNMSTSKMNAGVGTGDARILGEMLERFDDILDDPNILSNINREGSPVQPGFDVGKTYKTARSVYRRAKRSEDINRITQDAQLSARGDKHHFYNAVQSEFIKILKNPKTKRFYTEKEIKAMKEIVEGTSGMNVYKKIADHFDPTTQGLGTTMISGSAGTGIMFGMTGSPAMAAVGFTFLPMIGWVSRKLHQRAIGKKMEFANDLLIAGPLFDDIVKAYNRHTPRHKRTSQELSELLTRENLVIPENSAFKGVPWIDEARELARQKTQAMAVAGAVEAGVTGPEVDISKEIDNGF